MSVREKNIIDLRQKLAERGLKATPQRMIIFQILMSSHEHPSAELIFEKIKNTHPGISLGTVYKTLETLVEAGLAKKVKTAGDVLRFDAKTSSHSHLYCTKTSRILDYEDEDLHALLEDYFRRKNIKNFNISDIQVQINGELKD
jgi:Fur family transcriptional regulator, peroxide stress response regulator